MKRKIHFTIAEKPCFHPTHRIMELCEYLAATALEPVFASQGCKWSSRFTSFFTYDNGCDPLEPVGTVEFHVPGMFRGQVAHLEGRITAELAKLGIRTGALSYNRDPLGAVSSISIPIVENPTAQAAPPDVNMSHTRGCLVLRDILGYERVGDRYEFAADDLVRRVASVTEEKIADCTSSPVKSVDGVRRLPSSISMKSVRRCLDEVRQFAEWALQHNHPKLAAA